MPLPVTTAWPIGAAPLSATAVALPSPLGTIFSPGPAWLSRILCAITKLAANRTKRRANAYLNFLWGLFIVCNKPRCKVLLRLLKEMNRRSRYDDRATLMKELG